MRGSPCRRRGVRPDFPHSNIAMTWWQIAFAIGESVAAIAVAGFALVQLRKEFNRDEERRRTAEARISTSAFLLRRQLRSWLGIHPPRDEALDAWLKMARENGSLKDELDIAERRFAELTELAAEASREIANNVRRAYVLFLAGTNRINEFVSTPEPRDGEFFDWQRLKTDAEKDFKECLKTLEAAPISTDLLSADFDLEKLREAEDPFQQLADAIIEESERHKLEHGVEAQRPLPRNSSKEGGHLRPKWNEADA